MLREWGSKWVRVFVKKMDGEHTGRQEDDFSGVQRVHGRETMASDLQGKSIGDPTWVGMENEYT